MPRFDVIVNGDQENAGGGTSPWTGSFREYGNQNTYFGDGVTNRIIELDAGNNNTSVLQQTFTIGVGGFNSTLTFDAGQRSTGTGGTPGDDGAIIEVLDSSNNVVFTTVFRPTNKGSFNTFSFEFDLPGPGTYTLRFTETASVDNSFGTIFDNFSLLVCFADDTRIATPRGPVPVQNIKAGDLVLTQDHGVQPVRWAGSRHVRLSAEDDDTLRPIQIEAHGLGTGMPLRPLRVSPLHRLLLRNKAAKILFDSDEVLVMAKNLLNNSTISTVSGALNFRYHHLLLDQHEIVFANGLGSESLLMGSHALRGLTDLQIDEICKLQMFEQRPVGDMTAARRCLSDREAAELFARWNVHKDAGIDAILA